MANTPSVGELVVRWQELRGRGQAVSPAELCTGCPELIGEVEHQIEALISMERFVGLTTGTAMDAVPAATPASGGPEDTRTGGWPGNETAPPLVGSRYRPLRLHARGGLGEVFLARDEELAREVALKRIRRPRAGDAASRRRFLREGEITGGLEHPGVVPVYGLTRDAEGEPCYAMRFVRGHTLSEAIARLHATPEAGRGLALRRLLARFVVVCQTMAYAHSRGVVHRDLKPANIMLGDYGETLVVDWGLAKQMETAPPEQVADGGGSSDGAAWASGQTTATGELLGTPAFMSPEQAARRQEDVGPASDLYSLGATLYALLTGRAPFTGDSVVEILRQAQQGAIVPPRQVQPATPRPLAAICLKAMAREPAARYATAQALAADVERWLADEPVTACREPLRARLGRWARRHQAATGAAAAAVLVLVFVGTLAAWWLDRQRAEQRRAVQAEQRRVAEEALADAGRLQGEAKWAEARAVLDQVENRLGDDAPEDLRGRLKAGRADLEFVARLDELRERRASRVASDDFLPPRISADGIRQAFADRGLDVNDDPDGLPDAIQASPIKSELVAALDEWVWFTSDFGEKVRLLAVVRQADGHPWRDRFRDQFMHPDGRAVRELAAQAPVSELSPFMLATFAVALERAGGDRERMLRAALQSYPGDFWLNFDLGFLLHMRREQGAGSPAVLEEAIGFYRAALAARPRSSLAWTNLGGALQIQGRRAEAEAAARQAIRLQADNGMAHLNLSANLNSQGRYTEAAALCRDFIRRIDPKFHRIYLNLSAALDGLDDLDGARKACDTAIALRPTYARSWSRRGSVHFQERKYREAERDFREALRLDSGSAAALTGVIDCLRAQRKVVQAEALCREIMRARPKFAPAHLNLAGVLSDQGKSARAEAECRKAIDLSPDYADAYSALGVILLEQQRLTDALAAHRKAVSLAPADSGILVNCAAALREDGALGEAEACCRQAVTIRPRWDVAHFHLGLVQLRQGLVSPSEFRPRLFSQAEGSFRRAAELEPNHGRNHVRLGDALKWQGRFAAALAAYRRGDELGRQEPHWPYNSKALIQEAEQLVAAEARLASGLKDMAGSPRLDPLLAAQMYGYKRHYTAAAQWYARVFTAQPKRPGDTGTGDRYNAACFALLASRGQGEDAAKLDDKERARWRRQALGWLRADLERWTKQLEGGRNDRLLASRALRDWQRDADLAEVREDKTLAKLPGAEQKAWRQLWADVDALLRRANPASEP
jgi:tetratricopeptide (TPR) repeat protein/tRNA A-37 threonylcarbamoyl transferase component Bud32